MREPNAEARRKLLLHQVKVAQDAMFPEFADAYDDQLAMPGTGEHSYAQWAPIHHIETGLVTPEMVEELRQADSPGMLVVGCGRALLERILVEKLGVPAQNIALVDIHKQRDLPDTLSFLPLDMTSDESWETALGDKKFKYITFPESLIGAFDVMLKGLRFKELKNEALVKSHAINFIVRIFVRAAKHLAPGGEIIANTFGDRASLDKLRRLGLDSELRAALPDFEITITDNFIHLRRMKGNSSVIE